MTRMLGVKASLYSGLTPRGGGGCTLIFSYIRIFIYMAHFFKKKNKSLVLGFFRKNEYTNMYVWI